MCLIKKSKIPRIALKDITVYKSVDNQYGKLYTIITEDLVELGKTYKGIFRKSEFNQDFLNPRTLLSSLFSKYVTTGYIHSYISLKRSIAEWRYNTIVECIIPRGTLYFIGTNNEIASRKLKYVKIIDEDCNNTSS